jgi:pilus assembly protein FimV
MAYTNSRNGGADDVDPVAEADVYLAYGRDLQAEEILKEALRNDPSRLSIHTKLLEIYAKRRDAASFLSNAQNAFQLVGANSPEWARICEQGLAIDPENTLYQPGGVTASGFPNGEQEDPAIASGEVTIPATMQIELPHSAADLDLDLDFSDEDPPATGIQAGGEATADSEETIKLEAQDAPDFDALDFDISAPAEFQAELQTMGLPPGLPDLSLALDGVDLEPLAIPTPTPALPDFASTASQGLELAAMDDVETPAAAADGMLEFDLGSLSLDLGPGTQTPADEENADLGDNSLETKLALADEFVSIGDQDGARALIEEVVAEATGELREKALHALTQLG